MKVYIVVQEEEDLKSFIVGVFPTYGQAETVVAERCLRSPNKEMTYYIDEWGLNGMFYHPTVIESQDYDWGIFSPDDFSYIAGRIKPHEWISRKLRENDLSTLRNYLHYTFEPYNIDGELVAWVVYGQRASKKAYAELHKLLKDYEEC